MNMKNVLCSRLEFYEDWNNAPLEGLQWALMCKWVRHFFGVFVRKNVQFMWSGSKKKKKKWAWNCNYSQMTFPPVSSCRFWSSLSWQPSLYQVTCGQCSHCLFISVPASVRSFVHLSTSNPASGSFCPLQAQCQQPDFDVKPQFIRLSLRTPPAVHIMSGNQ